MSHRPFFLQMAGLPGSGKSSLARLIGHRTGAVVLDKDVIKSAALGSIAEDQQAGALSYDVSFALADHILGQELAVVMDSPSFYAAILEKGQAIALQRCVPYYFVECVCPDRDELVRRLRDRRGLPSNPGQEAADTPAETISPLGGHLRLDTTQPIERCLALALDYLDIQA